MFLELNSLKVPMKVVYLHSVELKNNPDIVAKTQALTLNTAKPFLGLKGSHGLYGSPQWWLNIEQRKMPLLFKSGVITRLYAAGMDSDRVNNCFDILLNDGSEHSESIITNKDSDIPLFRLGCWVEIVYVLDEGKKQPARDGGINYLDILLEMAISLQPVR